MEKVEALEMLDMMWEKLFQEMRTTTFNELKEQGLLEKFQEAHNIAIEALGQDSCEDCISRKTMLNSIFEIDNGCNMDIYTNEVREIVNDLPPVHPVSKSIIEDIKADINNLHEKYWNNNKIDIDKADIVIDDVIKIIDSNIANMKESVKDETMDY